MNAEQLKQQAFEQMMLISKGKGYVSIDDVLNCVDALKLPIDEVDRLCEILISNQVIFRDNVDDVEPSDNEDSDDYAYDKSRLDYSSLFDKVVAIEPSLTEYVRELRLIPPPRRGEEFSLLFHAKDGNVYARDRIITMYLKVALRIALWYWEKYGLPLDETIQDANIGLILALEKIPISSDKRFSTYAPWWIRQYIGRATQGISKKYIPVHIKDKLYNVLELKRQHECDNCYRNKYCPTLVNEICDKLKIDQDVIRDYLDILEEPLSIDDILEQNRDEDVFNDNGETMDHMLETEASGTLQKEFNTILSSLREREAEVLKLRYGLVDGKERTLEEVGQIFNLTRERIRQIEAKAIKRLQHPSRAKKVKSSIIKNER